MKCLFCSFLAGKTKNHHNGYPFSLVYQTKTIAIFLSSDTPVNKDAHLLVIPKPHFSTLTSVPTKIMNELIKSVKQAGQVLKKRHAGFNVLLNNGPAAGQFIPHLHFHIIPRNPHDNIQIEKWKRQKISPQQFTQLSLRTKNDFQRIKRTPKKGAL